MEKDLKWIKKHYGEKMMHLCRGMFHKILETEGLLPQLLEAHFPFNRHLADDLLTQFKEEEFKNFIYSCVDVEKEKLEVTTNKTAYELMSEAGYVLYPECLSEEDIQSFIHYYRNDERICTFWTNRLNSCRVWFAVKKNADELNREDFKNPQRQDEYGTSVISIQFTRSDNTLSIKNRYNHTVNNPDNTFNSNLDNIIMGLTDAFDRDFGVRDQLSRGNTLEIENYVNIQGKFYPYNYELNNIYYCENNIIIDNFQVKQLPNSQMLVDYFIVDFQNKTISLYDKKLEDSFCNHINNIQSIDFSNNILTITTEDDIIAITVDEHRRITSIKMENLTLCKDDFMIHNLYTTQLEMPSLKTCGDCFFYDNSTIKNINLPNLEQCGHSFLWRNDVLKNVNLPLLSHCGDDFLRETENLVSISLPSLKSCGKNFLAYAKELTSINLPELESCGDNFVCYNNWGLHEINLPKLKTCGNSFLRTCREIESVNLPHLESCGEDFLESSAKLLELNLPNLTECESGFLKFGLNLVSLSLPKLKTCKSRFLSYNTMLDKLYLPMLETCGNNFLWSNKNIKQLDLPNLETCKDGFLFNNEKISKINLPNLVDCGSHFMSKSVTTEATFPNLSKCGNFFFNSNENLTSLQTPNLFRCGAHFLPNNKELQNYDFSSLTKIDEEFLTNHPDRDKILDMVATNESNFNV